MPHLGVGIDVFGHAFVHGPSQIAPTAIATPRLTPVDTVQHARNEVPSALDELATIASRRISVLDLVNAPQSEERPGPSLTYATPVQWTTDPCHNPLGASAQDAVIEQTGSAEQLMTTKSLEGVKVCHNCRITDTSAWRRDEYGQTLCNKCGIHWKTYHVPRPVVAPAIAEPSKTAPLTVPRRSSAVAVMPNREGIPSSDTTTSSDMTTSSDKENVFPTLAERTKLNRRKASKLYAQSSGTPVIQESRKRKQPDTVIMSGDVELDRTYGTPISTSQAGKPSKATPRAHNQYTPAHLKVKNGGPSLGPRPERQRKTSAISLEEVAQQTNGDFGESERATTIAPSQSPERLQELSMGHDGAEDDMPSPRITDESAHAAQDPIPATSHTPAKRRFPKERTPVRSSKRLRASQDLDAVIHLDHSASALRDANPVGTQVATGDNEAEAESVKAPATSSAPRIIKPHVSTTPLLPVTPSPGAQDDKTASSRPQVGTVRTLTAMQLADIAKYTLPGEDLDWTHVTDPRRRKKLQSTVSNRKHRERKQANTNKRSTRNNAESTTSSTTVVATAGKSGMEDVQMSSTHPLRDSQLCQDIADAQPEAAMSSIHGMTAEESPETSYVQVLDSPEGTHSHAVPDTHSHAHPDVTLSSSVHSTIETLSERTSAPKLTVDVPAFEPSREPGAPLHKTKPLRPPRSVKGVMKKLNELVMENTITDETFVTAMKDVLRSRRKGKATTFVVNQARRILQLLELALPPRDDEALFLSGEEASQQLTPDSFFNGPIITRNQQKLPLHTVEQFLAEYYDDEAKVHIQDPGARVSQGGPHVRCVTIGQVKQRFADSTSMTDKPWNLLELATHREDGLRPAFLSTEDCCLLSKLKIPGVKDSASRKGYEPGWKEIEKWALVAQAGALTEPHQDSHGYSTFITVNQGIIGFGWLSNPTSAERTAWNHSPSNFIGGRWRYAILRPGMTVYFPAGTVHFVFRHPAAGHTLAFGGHVLRCSQIVHWVKTLLDEKRNPDITNEDISVSAPAYLERVENFVGQAMKNGNEAKWGGKENIEVFLSLKKEFMTMKMGRGGSPPKGK